MTHPRRGRCHIVKCNVDAGRLRERMKKMEGSVIVAKQDAVAPAHECRRF